MDHHVPGKDGLDARDERPGAKLGKGMPAAVCCDDVVTGLRAAVITDDQSGAEMARQKIG